VVESGLILMGVLGFDALAIWCRLGFWFDGFGYLEVKSVSYLFNCV